MFCGKKDIVKEMGEIKMKYEVRVTLKKTVEKEGLSKAMDIAAKLKVEGFEIDDISSRKSFETARDESPMPVRIVNKKKK